jgi:hypothetical protein
MSVKLMHYPTMQLDSFCNCNGFDPVARARAYAANITRRLKKTWTPFFGEGLGTSVMLLSYWMKTFV